MEGRVLLHMNRAVLASFIAGILWLSACTSDPQLISNSIPSPVALPSFTPSPLFIVTPAQSSIPSPTLTLPTQTVDPVVHLCSPLQGIQLAGLAGMISNPYHPPVVGLDDPHQGIDLAVLSQSGIALSGHSVMAAMPGRVAMTLNDRFPYGNALMIETILNDANSRWLQGAEIPSPEPTRPVTSALTCPAATLPVYDSTRRSIYILYAHLLQPVSLKVGELVDCGQEIGAIGSSGNALNPHLHFEVRVGPSAAQFTGMAHYDNSASAEEMSNYCLWRISGLFQLIDPIKILALPEIEQ